MEPDFPRLRVLITHSEAVAPDLARRLCAYGDEVWNLYGPTETTVWATGWRLSADMDAGLSSVSAPIGRPLAHVRAIVVDDQCVPVADGVEGELCLGGPSVARGYRGNEILARERFIEIDEDLGPKHPEYLKQDAKVKELYAMIATARNLDRNVTLVGTG